MKKIFISYSHKDKEWMEKIVKHLEVVGLKNHLNIWVDESLKAGDEWEKKIRDAIEYSDIAILLISTDFLNSEFIRKKELPWLDKRHSISRMTIIPFLLYPSNWKTDQFFIHKFEARPGKGKPIVSFNEKNGDREQALADFSIEVKSLSKTIDTDVIQIDDTDELFYKAFIIYRVLDLYEEDTKYTFEFNSNLLIYKNGYDKPIEIWSFVDELKDIEASANKFKNLFNQDNIEAKIGIVQNKGLSHILNELSSFFNTLRRIKVMDEKTINNMILTLSSYDILTFLNEFSDTSIQDISYMNQSPSSNTTDSIFLFSNFSLFGFQANELRQIIFKIIEEKFKKVLTHDGNNIYALVAFNNVFENVLSFIDINKGINIDFQEIISRIDLLKITLPIAKKFDFKTHNQALIKDIISDKSNVSIEKLYVEPKAILSYAHNIKEQQEIDTLYSFIIRDIKNIDFLILLGDFGHGKTTFFKYMTAKLSDKYKEGEYIPIYLSMRQHFRKNSTLKDAVSNTLFLKEKLTDEYWNKHKWLIFCDGFDELNVYHQIEPNWITLVFSTLLNESKKNNIKIVLSSRPVLFLDTSVKKDTLSQFDRLLLKPFDEYQIKKWLENWSKYNKLISLEMIKERNLLEVSQTPVILFLIATIFHEELNDNKISYRKSQVYKKFFDWTAKNGGFIEKGTGIKHSVPVNYRAILQEIATIIFIHPDAKSGMIHYKILLKELNEKFDNYNLNDYLNEKIFVAHAFKEAKPEHIEFIHQSLREYLVAEKVFNIYFNFCTTNHEKEDVFQFDYDQVIFTVPFTEAKINFFRDLVEENINVEFMDKIEYFVFDLNSVYEYYIKKDMNYIYKHYYFFENELIKSSLNDIFINITANIVLLDFLFKTYSKKEVLYTELTKILYYYQSNNELEVFSNLIKKSITNLTSYEIEINDFNFFEFNLSHNTYMGVDFQQCIFKDTNLSFVSFHESGTPKHFDNDEKTTTCFKECTFEMIEFKNTLFRNVEFIDCTFKSQQFIEDFQLENVDFTDCIFYDCDFKKEMFNDTVFSDCIIKNCSLIDYKLDEIDRDNFILFDCNFE